MPIYSFEEFRKNDIELKFLKTGSVKYPQFDNNFRENLSIIDVKMFNSKTEIQKVLQDYVLIQEPEKIEIGKTGI